MGLIILSNSKENITEIYHNLWQGSRPIPEEIIQNKFDVIVFCEDEFPSKEYDVNKNFPNMIHLYCPLYDDYKNPVSDKIIKKVQKIATEINKYLEDRKKY